MIATFAMNSEHVPQLFPPPLMERVRALADVDPDLVAERFDDPRVKARMRDTEVLITGWGCPPLDGPALRGAPRLRAVLHAAGTVKPFMTAAAWRRGLTVTSAAEANAIPVAEYTVAAVLFAGKSVFAQRDSYRDRRRFPAPPPGTGNFGRRVGVVGASRVGRRVLTLLRAFDLELRYHDPYTSVPGARRMELDELVATSDIVTLHAPDTPGTRHLIDRRRLALMRDGAVLINTARGALVDTAALTAELVTGRLSAILDVTEPEPLPEDSPLFVRSNVFLTPHAAGSQGTELARLGESVAAELERLVRGEEPLYPVRPDELDKIALWAGCWFIRRPPGTGTTPFRPG
jgi:phosphoglycerate dehydrogenase-like enzyme